MVSFMSNVPIETVFLVAMRSHGIDALQMKSIQHILACNRQLFIYGFILTSHQIFVIYNKIHEKCTQDEWQESNGSETRDSYAL